MRADAPDIARRLGAIRHLALDMDGTIYRGRTMFPWTPPFLGQMEQLGIGWTLLTNNSSRSVADYVRHLADMGLRVPAAAICTSTQATLRHLRSRHPGLRRWFIVGTRSMRAEFEEAGFVCTTDRPAEEPEGVVVGFDTGLDYAVLCRAAWWIQQGKPYVATHPDRVCPTDEPTVLIDCGSVCAALREATGRSPDAVLGKPDPALLREVLARHGLAAAHLAMVGDRLYTDMVMGREAGALSVLVLTGETTAAQAQAAQPPPDLVVADLAELGQRLAAARGRASDG